MKKFPILILGAGGFAREVFHHIKTTQCLYEPMGFFSDHPTQPLMYGVPVYNDLSKFRFVHFITAVGGIQDRQKLTHRAIEHGLVPCAPIVSDHVRFDTGEVKHGSIICPNTIMTCEVMVGFFTIVNLSCTIGHDVRIGDFVTISPGVNISGNVVIEDECYVGTGAMIREGIRIGKGATVGMGAVVVKDVKPGTTVISVAAKEKPQLAIAPVSI